LFQFSGTVLAGRTDIRPMPERLPYPADPADAPQPPLSQAAEAALLGISEKELARFEGVSSRWPRERTPAPGRWTASDATETSKKKDKSQWQELGPSEASPTLPKGQKARIGKSGSTTPSKVAVPALSRPEPRTRPRPHGPSRSSLPGMPEIVHFQIQPPPPKLRFGRKKSAATT
jgi:hypothetical protein